MINKNCLSMSENIIVLNSLGISFAKCKLEVHLSLLPLVYMIIVYFFQKTQRAYRKSSTDYDRPENKNNNRTITQ